MSLYDIFERAIYLILIVDILMTSRPADKIIAIVYIQSAVPSRQPTLATSYRSQTDI
jgi:hypothetical protein